MLRSKLPFVLAIVICLCTSISSYGQYNYKAANHGWSLSSASLQIDAFSQLYPELDYLGLLSITQQPISLKDDMAGFQKSENFDATIYGAKLGAAIGFVKNGNNNWKREIQVGAKVMMGGEVLLEYENKAKYENELAFCLVENTVELEVAHLFRKEGSSLGFFIGPSLSLGTSFSNELIIFRFNPNIDEEESFAVKNSVQLLGHVNAGFDLNLYKGLGMRMQAQYGCGYSVRNAFQDVMDRSFSVGYGLEYRFDK